MLVQVILDIMEGAQATHDIQQGHTITRAAIVNNLNQFLSNDTAQIMLAAENAVASIVGGRGSPCPNVPVPTFLYEFTKEIISSTSVKVLIKYKGYRLPKYTFRGCKRQVETNIDANGNPIQTSYTFPSDYAYDPGRRGKTYTQGGMVSAPTPSPSFVVEFTITDGMSVPSDITAHIPGFASGSYSATDFCSIMSFYAGKVNDADYKIGAIVGPARTWMVEDFDADTEDGGFSYQARMTFTYADEGWDPLVAYVNPDDGKPPADLVEGVGYYTPPVPMALQFPDFAFSGN